MSRAALLAGAAGLLGVLGAADALAAAEMGARTALAGVLAPLFRAGRSGTPPAGAERTRLALLAAGVALLGGFALAGPLLGLVSGLAGPAVVLALARHRAEAWRRAFARDAPAAARALADALGAGYSVRGALGEAGRHVRGAAGQDLREVGRALALGLRTEEAVERLRERARSEAWDTIAAAILLQREAGGDLALLLREIGGAQEEAARLERDARTATAQARFTGMLICGMPLGGLGLGLLLAPDAVQSALRSPASVALGAVAAGLQAGCLMAIRRLARPPR